MFSPAHSSQTSDLLGNGGQIDVGLSKRSYASSRCLVFMKQNLRQCTFNSSSHQLTEDSFPLASRPWFRLVMSFAHSLNRCNIAQGCTGGLRATGQQIGEDRKHLQVAMKTCLKSWAPKLARCLLLYKCPNIRDLCLEGRPGAGFWTRAYVSLAYIIILRPMTMFNWAPNPKHMRSLDHKLTCLPVPKILQWNQRLKAHPWNDRQVVKSSAPGRMDFLHLFSGCYSSAQARQHLWSSSQLHLGIFGQRAKGNAQPIRHNLGCGWNGSPDSRAATWLAGRIQRSRWCAQGQ